MSKIRLLYFSDSPASNTGFSRVAQGILENLLQTDKYQISILGINHDTNSPHRYEGMFRIYPAKSSGNVYGFNRVEEVIEKEKPDVIFINNDLWIVAEYAKYIPAGNKVICYSPVDAYPVYEEWLEPIDKVGIRVTTYTNYAKEGILKAKNFDYDISIIGHGVDTDEFYPIDDARLMVTGIPDDTFVIMSVARNQPRKRLDLFLKAAQMWLGRLPESDKKNILFYAHSCVRDIGWQLLALAKQWGVQDNFIVTDQSMMTPAKGLPLSSLCKIYNVANVHCLTSLGEGFGLPPMESAACCVAQIVPNNSASKELWEGRAKLIDIERWEPQPGGINTEGGVISVEHLVSILDHLYHNRDEVEKLSQIAYDYVNQEKFTWTYVAKQVDKVIMEVLSSDKVSVKYKE